MRPKLGPLTLFGARDVLSWGQALICKVLCVIVREMIEFVSRDYTLMETE